MKVKICENCGLEFPTKNGIHFRHVKYCTKNRIKPQKGKCVHCGEIFNIEEKPLGWMANHSRWCEKNPKRNEYGKRIEQLNTPEARLKAINGIKKAHSDGRYSHLDIRWFLDKKHTDDTKELIKKKALESNHRRFNGKTIEYEGILLDSSWELELAKRLDYLGIKWIRPDPIIWVDENSIKHNYFPDFYLPDFDLYIDPKNKFASEKQKEKIDVLMKTYDNIEILNTLEDCKNYTPRAKDYG